MTAPRDAEPPDRARRAIGLGLAGVMLASFIGGVVAFIPAEHRADKLAQMRRRYAAKYFARLKRTP